ncbi:MAG: immunoglobulin-like domain-containing protein [Clostridiaceae bacterium]
MRSLRRVIIIIFILTWGLFGAYVYNLDKSSDNVPPEISFTKDTMAVSVHASAGDLSEGVTAIDNKDGDVTSSVLIEGISRFTDGKRKIITYAAFDSGRNVSKKTRTITYTDYQPPKIQLIRELKLNWGRSFNLLEYVKAVDVIDGDISNKIIIKESDLNMNKEGIYKITLSVTNSSGDEVTATLPVEIVKQ